MHQKLTFEELKSNSSVLIIAGSETTATALSAITYYLCTNRQALDKLTHEVRTAFSSEEEIEMVSAQQLQYMQAVMNEGLRMYPPVPTGIVRRVTDDGGVFLGQYVPSGVSLRSFLLSFARGQERDADEVVIHRRWYRSGIGLPSTARRTSPFLTLLSPNVGSMMLASLATRRKRSNRSRSALETALAESKLHYPLPSTITCSVLRC